MGKMLTIFQIYGYFKFSNTVQNSRMLQIKFLILEKTFENFLRRHFRCLEEKEIEKKFLLKRWSSLLTGHEWSHVTYNHVWSQTILVLIIYRGHNNLFDHP